MDLFGVVSFVHNVEVRMSDPVTFFKGFFSVRDIMNRLLGDHEPSNDLPVGIDGDRGFQESFPGLSGSPGIVMAGVRAGKSG